MKPNKGINTMGVSYVGFSVSFLFMLQIELRHQDKENV